MILKELVSYIKNVSLAYPTIQEFNEGDIYEYLNNGEHKYPTVFLTIESITSNEDTQTLNASLFYVDRLLSDSSNKIDIQTVGLTALKSIKEKLEEANHINFTSINYTPFTEKFTDLCAGAFAQCTIQVNDVLECDDFELGTLTIKEDGLYNVLGYSQVIVDVTKVRTIGGKSGDITLGEGLTINDDNVLSTTAKAEWGSITGNITNQTDLVEYVKQQAPNIVEGENIYFTPGEGNSIVVNADDMRYDDSEVKGMIEDVADELDGLNEITIPDELSPTTTNFVEGTTYSIYNAIIRTANLFAGYWNYIKTNITDLIPSTASSTNQLADKSFVNETVAQNAANFRGNWQKWDYVPTNYELYPEDYVGNKKPTNNDYMVVVDSSDYGTAGKPINIEMHTYNGYVIVNGVRININNTEYVDYVISDEDNSVISFKAYASSGLLVKSNITAIYDGVFYAPDAIIWESRSYRQDKSITIYVAEVLSGSWRFLYTGDWDTLGKSGWKPAYRIGSAFTNAQQAAIDSTITKEKVDNYDGYDNRIIAVETDKRDRIYTANKLYATDAEGKDIALDITTVQAHNYSDLTNKPTINGVEVSGDKTSNDYKIYTKEVAKTPENNIVIAVPNEITRLSLSADTTITLDTPTLSDAANIYDIIIYAESAIKITWNAIGLKWNNDFPETLEAGKYYEINILNKLVVFTEWEA